MLKYGVEYDATVITETQHNQLIDRNRFQILYEVWLDGQDTGMSANAGVIQSAMLEVGLRRNDSRWEGILCMCEPFVHGDRQYTFKSYGPRQLVQTVAEASYNFPP